MRAVVIYESMYGNTRLVADAIAAGLTPAFETDVVPVSRASQELLTGADLVVVGGPTHAHGMSRASTRKAAADTASKPGSNLRLEPDATASGLREWSRALGHHIAKAAAFDTRMRGPALLTGRASKGLTRLLRAHGFEIAGGPESFFVTKQNRLRQGQADRARDWGTELAASIVPSPASTPGA